MSYLAAGVLYFMRYAMCPLQRTLKHIHILWIIMWKWLSWCMADDDLIEGIPLFWKRQIFEMFNFDSQWITNRTWTSMWLWSIRWNKIAIEPTAMRVNGKRKPGLKLVPMFDVRCFCHLYAKLKFIVHFKPHLWFSKLAESEKSHPNTKWKKKIRRRRRRRNKKKIYAHDMCAIYVCQLQ